MGGEAKNSSGRVKNGGEREGGMDLMDLMDCMDCMDCVDSGWAVGCGGGRSPAISKIVFQLGRDLGEAR